MRKFFDFLFGRTKLRSQLDACTAALAEAQVTIDQKNEHITSLGGTVIRSGMVTVDVPLKLNKIKFYVMSLQNKLNDHGSVQLGPKDRLIINQILAEAD